MSNEGSRTKDTWNLFTSYQSVVVEFPDTSQSIWTAALHVVYVWRVHSSDWPLRLWWVDLSDWPLRLWWVDLSDWPLCLQVYCDLHGHSRKKNVFMYGCSTAATVAASSSSSGELDSDVVEAIREKVAELSGSDSTSSMEPNDIVEDPGYRVNAVIFLVRIMSYCTSDCDNLFYQITFSGFSQPFKRKCIW